MKKRGQITIFVIAAVIILSIVLGYFLFRQGLIGTINLKPETNPNSYLQTCIEPHVREGVEVISSQGGYVNATFYKQLDEEKISYLCYQENYYLSCINQEPVLIGHLESELEDYLEVYVKRCYDDLIKDLGKSYGEEAEYSGFEIYMAPGKIYLDIDGKIILERTGDRSVYQGFRIDIPTKFYDTSVVIQEIVSQEARFCNFEQLGFMMLYPEWNIDKFRTGDGITIYTVKNRYSEESFKFAVRSCVIPPGL